MTFLEKVKEIKIGELKIADIEEQIEKKKEQIRNNSEQIEEYNSKIKELEKKIEELKLSKRLISEEKIELLNIIRNFLKNQSRIKGLINLFQNKQPQWMYFATQLQNINDRSEKEIEGLGVKLEDFFNQFKKQINSITVQELSVEYKCNSTEEIQQKIQEYKDICIQFQLMINDFTMPFFDNSDKSIDEMIKEFQKTINQNKDLKNIPEVNWILVFFEQVINILESVKKYTKLAEKFQLIKEFTDLINEYGTNIFNIVFLESEMDKPNRIDKEQRELRKDINYYKTLRDECIKRNKKLEKSLKEQIKKRDLLEKEKERIERTQTLAELGFKDEKEAINKLSIDTKDYVIIPIPSNIKNISDLFNKEKQIKIEAEGDIFFTVYTANEAVGRINNISHLNGEDSVLMIPIKDLKKEYVNNVNNGEISLNSSVLQLLGIIAFIPNGKKLDFESYNIDVRHYPKNETIEKQVLDVTDYISETQENTREIPYMFDKEQAKINDAVLNCIFENFRKRKIDWDNIKVNGKKQMFSFKNQKNIQTRKDSDDINEAFLANICFNIKIFLNSINIGQRKTSCLIDTFYGKMIAEYMRINKKARADYIEEQGTRVYINGKYISIKPPLPAKKNDIIKRYSRNDENIAYKIMKLAYLVNQFAHITEEKKLSISKELFEIKKALIKKVIELSRQNESIKIKRKFDDEKLALSVSLEIPGYTEIALHVLELNEDLRKDIEELPERPEEHVVRGTSVILAPGVNIELLNVFNAMTIEERVSYCYRLKKKVLHKLIIRMGYSKLKYLEYTTEDEQKKYLKEMLSDKNLKRLMEMQEEER